jgi:hypothetical protein
MMHWAKWVDWRRDIMDSQGIAALQYRLMIITRLLQLFLGKEQHSPG